MIDNTKYACTFGFASALYVATNTYTPISLVRSNGTYNKVTLSVCATNGTAKGVRISTALPTGPRFLDGM